MGSTVALADASGNIQTQYTYGPYGNTMVSGATNDNPYQFHGREAEPMNGLFAGMYYFRARYLDTGLSRFVSRDPAGFQGGQHLYNYGANAPTMVSDPTGQDAYEPAAVIGWFYGYTLGFAYGVEAYVDPSAANSATGKGLTAASDVGFGASVYGAAASEALSTASLVGLVAFFTKLVLSANANAAEAAEAYAEAFGTNAESVSNGGGVIVGAPPLGPASANWQAFLEERGLKLTVVPKDVSPPVRPATAPIPSSPCVGGGAL